MPHLLKNGLQCGALMLSGCWQTSSRFIDGLRRCDSYCDANHNKHSKALIMCIITESNVGKCPRWIHVHVFEVATFNNTSNTIVWGLYMCGKWVKLINITWWRLDLSGDAKLCQEIKPKPCMLMLWLITPRAIDKVIEVVNVFFMFYQKNLNPEMYTIKMMLLISRPTRHIIASIRCVHSQWYAISMRCLCSPLNPV